MCPNRPIVREAIPDDLDRLAEIQTAALAEPWPELLATGVDGPLPVFVVESARPVGYALAVPGDAAAYLAEIAVAPARHGEGLGTLLLSAVLDRLASRGVDTVRLTVRADDRRARSFYRDFDFSVVERVADHYADADGLVLGRAL